MSEKNQVQIPEYLMKDSYQKAVSTLNKTPYKLQERVNRYERKYRTGQGELFAEAMMRCFTTQIVYQQMFEKQLGDEGTKIFSTAAAFIKGSSDGLSILSQYQDVQLENFQSQYFGDSNQTTATIQQPKIINDIVFDSDQLKPAQYYQVINELANLLEMVTHNNKTVSLSYAGKEFFEQVYSAGKEIVTLPEHSKKLEKVMNIEFVEGRKRSKGLEGIISSKNSFSSQSYNKINKNEYKLDSIGGYDEQKGIFRRIINLINDYETYSLVQDDFLDKGLILYGPPGTGKTSFIKAMAVESKAKLIYVTRKDIASRWHDGGLEGIRAYFKKAVNIANSGNFPFTILHFDEIDGFAKTRGAQAEDDKLVGAILTFLDGDEVNTATPIMVTGTTNIDGEIDPAIVRSGRLKLIEVGMPTENQRESIFKVCQKRRNEYSFGRLGKDVIQVSDYSKLALNTEGFSGADIFHLVRETLAHTYSEYKEKNIDFKSVEAKPVGIEDILRNLPEFKKVMERSKRKMGII